jgi:hypothetical protein
MSQREVAIVGSNNTKAKVTGQEELLVKVNSTSSDIFKEIKGTAKSAESLRVLSGGIAGITEEVHSISFASVGTGNVSISSNGGVSFVVVKPGETVSFNAGDINNYFASNMFYYETTALNAELLIVYTY